MAATDVYGYFKPSNVLCGLGAYIAWKVVYALYLSPLRNVPGSFWTRISKLPMFIADIQGTEREFMLWHQAKYGDVFVMEPAKIAVCDPDDCTTILGSHAFAKDQKYSNVEFIEPNVFLTRDPGLNKQRRRQIGPVLGVNNLLKMEDVILAAGPEQLIAKWDQRLESSARVSVCYHYDFMLMTFDIIGTLGFGQSHRSLTTGDRRIAHWVKQSFVLLFLQIVLPLVKSWPFKRLFARSIYQSVEEFISFGTRAIEQRKHLLAELDSKKQQPPNDILQSFIDAEDPESNGIKMTHGQVVAETIISLLAGSDTSSNTLSWTIHLLLMHPEHLARVTREVRATFHRNHTITYVEAQKSLPFLEACMYESMRLMPVSSNLPRCMPRGGTVIQGFFIPEDYTCSVSTLCANMNRRLWPTPHKYMPDRFLNNEAMKRRIMTFSMGVRACPGKHLALMEILTTLANILNAYDLEIPDDALFTPDRVDKDTGLPVLMPCASAVTCAPRFPDRDCNVMISKRTESE
ncbi:hypothetical protein IW140_002096 [Coemansia sp. RSA 1813]|nr:hypothetical protein EV178_001245 [Coemansia sp. RSA 1646]KAJ1772598.1 hypothetical protein LPJ74_001314 [Coemansia sp. RSA 1843]KAJ2091454.1 hypothetical protein IW138_001913 [Coemansia sp. RSA 986]KAJ2213882.1 hypothetical protein EV179_003466 [Coemansia sp. RSA 487]KAJ2570670.1 hypothetical protein IW140_002096 [Coemansia sp. RSA 1813]